MKLFYSYMWHLFAQIPTLLEVVRITLKIFSPAIKRDRMEMFRRLLFVLPFCFTLFVNAQAQPAQKRADAGQILTDPLLVGQKVPEDFWKKEHLMYIDGDTVRSTLEKYRGKPLLIDFWASWCSTCLNSFSKLDGLKQFFGDNFNILLVNGKYTGDTFPKIKKTYDSLNKRRHEVSFPSVMDDEFLGQMFPHVGIPYVAWITRSGRLQSLTRSQFLIPEAIRNLLN